MVQNTPNNTINQVRKIMLHIAISSFVVIGIFLSSLKSSAQITPNNTIISGMSNVSVYYHFGGNSFEGMFFRGSGKALATGENISIAGSNIVVNCKSMLAGYYYNTNRGLRLRPLDTLSLQTLSIQDVSYSSMTMTGGFFTDCTGINVKSNEIYGQIKHTLGGVDYFITAGTDYNFISNTKGNNLSGSLITTGGNVRGYIYDNNGGIGELGITAGSDGITRGISNGNTVTSQCTNFTKTQQSGSNIILTCTGNNVNQYVLNLFTSGGNQYTGTIVGGAASYTRSINNIATGNYTASCVTMIGSSACSGLNIAINTTGSTNTTYYSGARFVNSIGTIEHARLKRLYSSEIFEIQGIGLQVPVTLTKGFLYVNGTGVGQTGLVNNGDKLQIELISSDEYETSVSTQISLPGLTGTFTIITMNPDDEICQLTKEEQDTIKGLFESIKTGYSYNSSKRNNLLYIMKSMIKDVQDFDYNCSLQYLQDLAEQNINGEEEATTHTAPNCKEYPIIFNTDKGGYTSSKFKKVQYFASREALVRFIDSKNPGDCHINTYSSIEDYDNTDETKHVAPNGKVYEIAETDGLFSSPTITTSSKKFDNRDALTAYIDRNNPTIEIRDHSVDTTRDPITYATQNNKEYKIYKTDKGYMSYKLIKPKYFETLEEIQSYIDRNNRY